MSASNLVRRLLGQSVGRQLLLGAGGRPLAAHVSRGTVYPQAFSSSGRLYTSGTQDGTKYSNEYFEGVRSVLICSLHLGIGVHSYLLMSVYSL